MTESFQVLSQPKSLFSESRNNNTRRHSAAPFSLTATISISTPPKIHRTTSPNAMPMRDRSYSTGAIHSEASDELSTTEEEEEPSIQEPAADNNNQKQTVFDKVGQRLSRILSNSKPTTQPRPVLRIDMKKEISVVTENRTTQSKRPKLIPKEEPGLQRIQQWRHNGSSTTQLGNVGRKPAPILEEDSMSSDGSLTADIIEWPASKPKSNRNTWSRLSLTSLLQGDVSPPPIPARSLKRPAPKPLKKTKQPSSNLRALFFSGSEIDLDHSSERTSPSPIHSGKLVKSWHPPRSSNIPLDSFLP